MAAHRRICRLALLLVMVLCFLPNAYSQVASLNRPWESFLKKGEKLLAENENGKKAAGKFFQVASDFAAREERQDGVMRAAFGFLAAGQPDAAMKACVRARDIAWKKKDWQGVLRAGVCMLRLERGKEAVETLRIARDLAGGGDKPIAAIWAARGLLVLDQRDEAERITNHARTVFEKMDDWKGLFGTAQNYAMLNDGSPKANALFDLIREQSKNEEVKSYPRLKSDTLLVPGWGKTEPGLARKLEVTSAPEKKSVSILVMNNVKSIGGDPLGAMSVVQSVKDPKTDQIRDAWKRLGVRQVRAEGDTVSFELDAHANIDYFRFALTDPALGIRCKKR